MKYKVGDNIFEVTVADRLKSWDKVSWHYDPFETETDEEPVFTVELCKGSVDSYDGMTQIFDTKGNTDEIGMLILTRTTDAGTDYMLELTQPGDVAPNVWLSIDATRRRFVATVDEDSPNAVGWRLIASLTSAMQLAYMIGVLDHDTVMTHSSCVMCDGYAHLFLGKSGTGKSTHSRMWLQSVEGSELLNDDHPVLRVAADGTVTAYGSPWSGKTDCYRNLSAPVRAIVRIVRAPHNQLRRLSPVEAYASITPSLFSTHFDAVMTEKRHAIIERIVMGAPMYQMQCLPDHDAAQVCHQGVR